VDSGDAGGWRRAGVAGQIGLLAKSCPLGVGGQAGLAFGQQLARTGWICNGFVIFGGGVFKSFDW
jgi:hypothetical protein